MEKYKITITSESAIQELNEKIAIDSLFSVGEAINQDTLFYGDNYTNDERIYYSALEYSREHKGVQVQRLDTFVFVEGPYKVYKDENGETQIKRFEPINHTFVVDDTYIQVDGYRMKIKTAPGYTYKLRKTFIGTDDITRLCGMFVSDFWEIDTQKIVNHVRQYGQYYQEEQNQ